MQDIDKLVNDSINQIDDKVTGVNLLEKLKYLLIDKLKFYDLEKFDKIYDKEYNFNNGDIDFLAKIEKYKDNISRIKKINNNDNLAIVLAGNITISIHAKSISNHNNLQYISKQKGIALSKNTIIDELILKDTILLSVTIINSENNHEKA